MKSDDQLTELGRKIRAARKERHLSQRDLAELSGVSLSTIRHIETTQIKTTANNLAAVLHALDLDKDGIAINIKSSNDRWHPDREEVIEGLKKVWDAFNHMEHELYADYVFDALVLLKEGEK